MRNEPIGSAARSGAVAPRAIATADLCNSVTSVDGTEVIRSARHFCDQALGSAGKKPRAHLTAIDAGW